MAGLSKLEAVNLMLSNLGEVPVSSLAGAAGDVYVTTAETVLDEVSRAIQAQGWEFNTDKNYTVVPDIDSQVVIASNIITMDTMPGGLDVTVRQGKLYNKTAHTFLFTDNLTCEVLWEFDYEDLPQYVRHYIAVRAARILSNRLQGDVTGSQLTVDDEREAKATANRHDMRNSDRTMFDSDHYGIGRLKTRRM